MKAKLPLHIRTYECDACDMVIDRDVNVALDLAALAAAAVAGTGVAGDQDIAPAVSKPRGADQKTRTTRSGRKARPGRARGVIPQQRKEARDRPQTEALTLWGCDGPSGRNARDAGC